jgi:replicative superfamily II helicase
MATRKKASKKKASKKKKTTKRKAAPVKRKAASAVKSILNKNKVKQVIYQIFGAKRSLSHINSLTAEQARKDVLLPSVYRSVFDSHTAREAEVTQLALSHLIKVIGSPKQGSGIDKLATELRKKVAQHYNERLSLKYSSDELKDL